MNEAVGVFDQELQMFRDGVHELDPTKLRFLRWLGEQGRLEHDVFGPPAGECAELIRP